MEKILTIQLLISEIQAIIKESIESLFIKYCVQTVKEEDKDTIFNLQDACEFLQLARPTIYRYTSLNVIPHIKRGKKLFFIKADLLKWLKDGKKVNVAELSGQENFFMLNTRKKHNKT